jgi:hypothetical protein
VIQYPLVHGAANDPRGSILVPRLRDIRDLGRQAFPVAGTLPSGLDTIPEDSTDAAKTKLPAVTCYAPPPTKQATPRPTVRPSSAPSNAPPSDPPVTEPPPTEPPPPTDKPGGPKTPEPSQAPEPAAG